MSQLYIWEILSNVSSLDDKKIPVARMRPFPFCVLLCCIDLLAEYNIWQSWALCFPKLCILAWVNVSSTYTLPPISFVFVLSVNACVWSLWIVVEVSVLRRFFRVDHFGSIFATTTRLGQWRRYFEYCFRISSRRIFSFVGVISLLWCIKQVC